MKHRQCNGQKEKDKQDLQNITQKAKDRATRTSLKIEVELILSGRALSSYFICYTHCVTFVTTSGDDSGMTKGPGSNYEKRNKSTVIWDTFIK